MNNYVCTHVHPRGCAPAPVCAKGPRSNLRALPVLSALGCSQLFTLHTMQALHEMKAVMSAQGSSSGVAMGGQAGEVHDNSFYKAYDYLQVGLIGFQRLPEAPGWMHDGSFCACLHGFGPLHL